MSPYANPDLSRPERVSAVGYNYEDQPKERVGICNICGGSDLMEVGRRDRYGFSARSVTCRACSLTFLDPRLSRDGYSLFYQKYYRPLVSAYYGRRINAKTVQDEQRKPYAAELAAVMEPYLRSRKNCSFLDVGGSTGVIAHRFAEDFGVKPTVLDPSPDELREAEAMGIETILGLVEDWDPRGRGFDIVCMIQTIDHLLDPTADLSKLRAVTADDGLFLVDVVDFRYAFKTRGSIEEAAKVDHPFCFTGITAEALLARSGFKPLASKRSMDGHLLIYICEPCSPDSTALPQDEEVQQLLEEIRKFSSPGRSCK